MEFWFPGKIAVKGVKNGKTDVSIESQFLLFTYVLLIVIFFFNRISISGQIVFLPVITQELVSLRWFLFVVRTCDCY